MGGFFLLGSVLPKGAKNSGWRQSSFDGLKPKIFDMGLAPRFHMSSLQYSILITSAKNQKRRLIAWPISYIRIVSAILRYLCFS
jgi:hypothetical protein